jgi:hypothetical protein
MLRYVPELHNVLQGQNLSLISCCPRTNHNELTVSRKNPLWSYT